MADIAKKNAVASDELASKFKSEKETPYTRWVKAEGLDIIPSFYVRNLRTVALKPWARRGGNAVFLNHDASRTSNDCHVMEIPPGKKFHDIQPGAIHANPPQREQLAHLGDHRVLTVAQEGPPLGLQRLDVRGEKADLLPRTLKAGPEGERQWGAIPLAHLVKLGVHIALQGELHAMAG